MVFAGEYRGQHTPAMADILKLPMQPSRRGYRRVKKRCRSAEDPNQLDLFAEPSARILDFAGGLSPFEKALMCDERGDARAAELYNEAIQKEDCVADAWCNLGIIESQFKNTIKAFDCFTTALKHDPRHSEANYNLGNLYFENNDFRLAQFHFEIAADVDPDFANAFFNLALVQIIENNTADAAIALGRYKKLVSEPEGCAATEMIEQLKRSLAAVKNSRTGST
jgi:tetratricopeptide (TPR) repeat protein